MSLEETGAFQKLRASTSPQLPYIDPPQAVPVCPRREFIQVQGTSMCQSAGFECNFKSSYHKTLFSRHQIIEAIELCICMNFMWISHFLGLSVAWTQLLTCLYAFAHNFHLSYNDSLQLYLHPSLPAMSYSFLSHSSNTASLWNDFLLPHGSLKSFLCHNLYISSCQPFLLFILIYILLYSNSLRLETQCFCV